MYGSAAVRSDQMGTPGGPSTIMDDSLPEPRCFSAKKKVMNTGAWMREPHRESLGSQLFLSNKVLIL